MGIEPTTLWTTTRCSNQLSYSHRGPARRRRTNQSSVTMRDCQYGRDWGLEPGTGRTAPVARCLAAHSAAGRQSRYGGRPGPRPRVIGARSPLPFNRSLKKTPAAARFRCAGRRESSRLPGRADERVGHSMPRLQPPGCGRRPCDFPSPPQCPRAARHAGKWASSAVRRRPSATPATCGRSGPSSPRAARPVGL